MKVRAFNIPRNVRAYITPGKWYDVLPHHSGHRDFGRIVDDEGDKISICFKACAHLDKGAWEVAE